MTLLQLREKLEKTADKDSTWTPEHYTHPLMGHCGNFTLITRLECRGVMMRGWAVGEWAAGIGLKPQPFKLRHYWNRIKDIDVDWTWQQFPIGTKLVDIEEAMGDTDIISDNWINMRYKNFFRKFYNQ